MKIVLWTDGDPSVGIGGDRVDLDVHDASAEDITYQIEKLVPLYADVWGTSERSIHTSVSN